MTQLTDAQLARLTALLDEQEARTRRQLAGAASNVPPPIAEETYEEADLATQEINELAGDIMVARYQHELDEVEATRTRMRQHAYGICTDCGEPIPFLRLQAQPTALRCLACQTARERHWA